ncbi:enediyne antibiotic chromoprotein [Actinokineospora sp. NPDC004072]
MRVANKAKNAARFGAAAGLALGLAVAFQPMASAAPAAAGLNVTPATGLSHGDTVSVSVTGFTPNTTVFIGQCAAVGGDAACPAGDPLQVTTNASGAATATLAVKKTFDAFRLDGTPVGVVDCATAVCAVAASEASGNGLSVTLSFK